MKQNCTHTTLPKFSFIFMFLINILTDSSIGMTSISLMCSSNSKAVLMGYLEDELSEVKKLCEHVVAGTKLVSCVRTMVRVEIKKTVHKTITVCAQFPEDYPNSPLLFELKSKSQILPLLKFVRKFIDENSLICCYDEINALKLILSGKDQLKLKQKSSTVVLKVYNEEYYLIGRVMVPDNYPSTAVDIQQVETNFTTPFYTHMIAQAKEIARRCVEAPLHPKPNAAPFVPIPSMEKTLLFLIDCVKRLPFEECPFCTEKCFPSDAKLLERDPNSPNHIERVYCGHVFHQGCLLEFMKQPPFGNKKCAKCGAKLYHFKWSQSDKKAEARWAHEQARDRELQEVSDFLK
ncbi:uncharacterized protein LOC109535627 isoform X2 [Dendroctonus ponderosae]|uniref:uncharacterized protein LOC109535627 isoform X2 n=1 Tax=Dendroctonus ponderosae TaxID=77166 RepID=UPI002034CC37|nr:uncharacterized protein LOC109535627 isoform X2 [Dendroctonus ponderosae]